MILEEIMNEIKNKLCKLKWDNIIISLLSILIGVLCICLPKQSADTLCIIFGSFLIAIGVTLIIRFFVTDIYLGEYSLILGISELIIGIFCLIKPTTIQSILTVLFGLYILIDSVITLSDSITMQKAKISGWLPLLILSILTCLLGIIIMFSYFKTVIIFAGISLIIEGIKHFITTIVFSKKIKKAKNELNIFIQSE